MYGKSTNNWLILMVYVGKYSIHGWYGNVIQFRTGSKNIYSCIIIKYTLLIATRTESQELLGHNKFWMNRPPQTKRKIIINPKVAGGFNPFEQYYTPEE